LKLFNKNNGEYINYMEIISYIKYRINMVKLSQNKNRGVVQIKIIRKELF